MLEDPIIQIPDTSASTMMASACSNEYGFFKITPNKQLISNQILAADKSQNLAVEK